jgi:hypothetical protein
MIKIWICRNIVAYVSMNTCNYGDTQDYYKNHCEMSWFEQ